MNTVSILLRKKSPGVVRMKKRLVIEEIAMSISAPATAIPD